MKLMEGACWVVVEDGDMLLYGPNGEELRHQEAITATADMADGFATCQVSFICNIAGSKEEMMRRIPELYGEQDINPQDLKRVQERLKKNRFMEWLKDLVNK